MSAFVEITELHALHFMYTVCSNNSHCRITTLTYQHGWQFDDAKLGRFVGVLYFCREGTESRTCTAIYRKCCRLLTEFKEREYMCIYVYICVYMCIYVYISELTYCSVRNINYGRQEGRSEIRKVNKRQLPAAPIFPLSHEDVTRPGR